MPERDDAARDGDEPVSLCRAERIEPEARLCEDLLRRFGRIRPCSRHHEKCEAGVVRQPCDAGAEGALEAAVHGHGFAQRLGPRQLVGRERDRQLGQCERIPLGDLQERPSYTWIDRDTCCGLQHGLGLPPPQPLELEGLEIAPLVLGYLSRPTREHHGDGHPLEPTGAEEKGRARRLVEPLDVVDDDEDGTPGGQTVENAADGNRHGQPVDAGALVETERPAQCLRLGSGQRVELPLAGAQQGREPGEREVRRLLRAGRSEQRSCADAVPPRARRGAWSCRYPRRR